MRPLLALTLAAFCLSSVELQAAENSRPNIIVILVDDMGFSDIGCYGSEIPTPNIDKLAANGVRFTQFYNTGRCCPTRAALLTGLYSHQAGIGHMVEDQNVPGYRGFLNDQCVTLGEVMRSAGYFTAMTGKWHVGNQPEKWPAQRGFDSSYGGVAGGFYFKLGARKMFENDKPAHADGQLPAGFYSTDVWTDRGIKFIDEALVTKKPFLLYLAHNAPHFPLQAPAEDIAKFRGQYKAGWDKLREARYAKQIELGIIDKSWPLTPLPNSVKAWDKLTPDEQDRFDHIMAIYAAVMSKMDSSIGRLVDALKSRNVLDNTLIFFMSDNGGNAEGGPGGTTKGEPWGGPDSNIFSGESWATLQNTPFRRFKHFNHEGGIATPLIAHWPARIKTPGELRQHPGHLIDIMATCVEVSGAKYPTELKGKPITPMEGKSLVPAFDNKPIDRGPIFFEHEGNRAVREGDWKLVATKAGEWELYNLKDDRTELKDLAAKEPDRAKALADKWEAWALRANVKPRPGAKKKQQ